jgi:hypothetical protein
MMNCFSTFFLRAQRWAAPEQARTPSGGQKPYSATGGQQ